jgi:hypothetical protein
MWAQSIGHAGHGSAKERIRFDRHQLMRDLGQQMSRCETG